MKTINIEIPDMQSTHCQMRVRSAIGIMKDLAIQKVSPGTVELQVPGDFNEKLVIDLIRNSGYTVSGISPNTESNEDRTYRFKTNINCQGCIDKVSPALNNAEGICHWEVDTNHPEKVLEVHSNGISREEVMDKVRNSGFKIENK